MPTTTAPPTTAFTPSTKRVPLDINAHLAFALAPLHALLSSRVNCTAPRIYGAIYRATDSTKALALLDNHRQQGHRLVIITATNRFITGPIAKRLE